MANNNFNEDRNAFLQKAEALLRENNMSAILNLAGQRLQNHPSDADALGIYCEALIGTGRIEEMRQWLIRVEEIISGLNLVHERVEMSVGKTVFIRKLPPVMKNLSLCVRMRKKLLKLSGKWPCWNKRTNLLSLQLTRKKVRNGNFLP